MSVTQSHPLPHRSGQEQDLFLNTRGQVQQVRNLRYPGTEANLVPGNIPERASGVKGLLASLFWITSWVVYARSAPKPGGPFLDSSDWLRNRLWDSAVTVMFFEVVRAVLFTCGGTPIHPFVNPPALSGSRPGRLGPDTEYSVTTVSRTKAVSIKITLDNRAESMFLVRLALRPRGPLLHQVGGPMQPPIPSL